MEARSGSTSTIDLPDILSDTPGNRKRRASPGLDLDREAEESSARKRLKDDHVPSENNGSIMVSTGSLIGERAVEELALELQCGCCTELVYRPVLVLPCQHFFCGRCVPIMSVIYNHSAAFISL
jgi:E3 ubiquitin-protein ligase CHFR